MKLTKSQIKKIIQEEIQGLLNETDTKRGSDGKKVKKTGGGRSLSKKEREQSKGKRTKDGKIVKPSGVGGPVDEAKSDDLEFLPGISLRGDVAKYLKDAFKALTPHVGSQAKPSAKTMDALMNVLGSLAGIPAAALKGATGLGTGRLKQLQRMDEVEPIPRKKVPHVHMLDEAGPTPFPSPAAIYKQFRSELQDGEVKHVDDVIASL